MLATADGESWTLEQMNPHISEALVDMPPFR